MVSKYLLAGAVGSVALTGLLAKADGPAFGTGPTQQDQLRAQLSQLQATVSDLEAQQARATSQVATTVEQVLRDAERRSSLLAAEGSSAGYDNGFFIRSGDFLMRPGFNFQLRNVTDYRSNTDGAKDDEIENGFEIRRMQLKLEGTAFTPDLTYFFQWNANRNGGESFLEDAYARYMFADKWGARAGQWKEPFSHEKILSDSRLLAVERSLLDATLGGGYGDRIQGASLIYGGQTKGNPFNAEAAFTDGSNSWNSNYVGHYPSDPPALSPSGKPTNHNYDWGIAIRAEWMAMGDDWKNYNDLTAAGTKDSLLVLGGGVRYNEGGNGNDLSGTIDLQYENQSGWGFYGAAMVRQTDGELSSTTEDQTDWGILLQGSYMFNPAWEAFVRYSLVQFDEDVVLAGGEDMFHEISLGVAYYLGQNGSAGNRAKVTMDLNWLPNGSPAAYTGLGYLGDSGGDNEVVIRGQFQLAL